MNLLELFSKQGSKGKNVSSLSHPPKARESSDSSRSSKMKESETTNRPPALACLRNSATTDGRHTYSHHTIGCKCYYAFDTLEQFSLSEKKNRCDQIIQLTINGFSLCIKIDSNGISSDLKRGTSKMDLIRKQSTYMIACVHIT